MVEIKPANHWFHLPLQVIGIFFCVYFYFHLPSSGKALLILGAMSAIMMFMDMRPMHKGIYVLIVLSLVLIENRALDKERMDSATEQARIRSEENEKFQGIADKLSASLEQSQAAFYEMMSRLGTLTSLSKENLNTVTGGDTYCFIDIPGRQGRYPAPILAYLEKNGDYPLYGVRMKLGVCPSIPLRPADCA